MNTKKQFLQIAKAGALVFFFALGANAALSATWAPATDTPPNSNAGAPITDSSTGQTKEGGLVLNTSGATYGLIVDSGSVGIGTLTPGYKLDVNGNLNLSSGSALYLAGTKMLHATFPVAYPTIPNFFIGYSAGNTTMTGWNNIGIGRYALLANTTGSNNVALGSNLTANTTGERNVAIGYGVLNNNTTGSINIAVGDASLQANTTGLANAAFGSSALTANTSGGNNNAFGGSALGRNTTGGSNNAFGQGALYTNTTGSYNLAIGYSADVASAALTNATAIGKNAIAGASNTLVLGGTGVDAVNVGIGVTAPVTAVEVVQNKAIKVGNAYVSSGTIAGVDNTAHFASNAWFNGTAWTYPNGATNGALMQFTGSSMNFYSHDGAGTFTNMFSLNSTAAGFSGSITSTDNVNVATGYVGDAGRAPSLCIGRNGECAKSWSNGINLYGASSDVRLKKNIVPLQSSLEKLAQLQGVSFDWINPDELAGRNNEAQIGLIAQDVEKLYPSLVTEDNKGMKRLNYSQLVAPLIEAVKELKADNESLEKENVALKKAQAGIEERLRVLEESLK